MISAREALDIVNTIDITPHTKELTLLIMQKAKEGECEITFHTHPYNTLGSHNASPVMRLVKDELISKGFTITYNPAQDQRDTSTTRVSW